MRNIKILSALLVLFTFNKYLSAQDCKVASDEFTNEKVVSFDFKKHAIYYELRNGVISFEIKFNYQGEMNVIVNKGAEILYKLENGEIIKLITVEDSPPNTFVGGSSILTIYTFKVAVSKEQIEKLALSKVSLLRYPDTKGGYSEYDLKKGGFKIFGKAIFDGAICMKNSL